MKKILIILFLMIVSLNYLYSQIPNPPTLLYPANGATNIPRTVTLDWNTVPTATSYKVQVSLSQTFTSLLVDNNCDSSQYTIPMGTLSNFTQYYWRVNATNQFGTSPWSVVWNFTTNNLPISPPTLLFPPNGATGISINPIFEWFPVSGATYYIFQLSKSQLFDTLIVYDTTPPPLPAMNLQYDTWYYWRVRAGNSGGVSNWSTVYSFHTIMLPPPPPVLIYPCGVTGVPLTPILDWDLVPTATSYRIQVSTVISFSTMIINTFVTLSQYQVLLGELNYNTIYYWRVNATNEGGTGLWSSICNFTTVFSSGVKIISSEVPAEYKLYNNYPNPFNPVTKIKFDIAPSLSFPNAPIGNPLVVLKVYDILGKEVATLVNEQLAPGTYTVDFDAKNFPSGIYFYRLITDGFIGTKRMTLIK